ncbi:hypothetical protein [Caviibacterium pharyngocola]|uniref:Uncharacterized protein n=1 Tax=Caviibacterium pharyngocola TaxID=28159 RepID=A0A2M8RV88_9PAST|nr:hypothetical protein [Caviibacterium pharyngocola]PJG82799.1 hypothetical protein CVP04_07505 [Caviibacterium pharyngocola]
MTIDYITILIILILIFAIIFSFSSKQNLNEIIELRLDRIDVENGLFHCLDYKNKAFYFYKKDIAYFEIEYGEVIEQIFAGTNTIRTIRPKFVTFLLNGIKFRLKDVNDNQINFFKFKNEKH